MGRVDPSIIPLRVLVAHHYPWSRPGSLAAPRHPIIFLFHDRHAGHGALLFARPGPAILLARRWRPPWCDAEPMPHRRPTKSSIASSIAPHSPLLLFISRIWPSLRPASASPLVHELSDACTSAIPCNFTLHPAYAAFRRLLKRFIPPRRSLAARSQRVAVHSSSLILTFPVTPSRSCFR